MRCKLLEARNEGFDVAGSQDDYKIIQSPHEHASKTFLQGFREDRILIVPKSGITISNMFVMKMKSEQPYNLNSKTSFLETVSGYQTG